MKKHLNIIAISIAIIACPLAQAAHVEEEQAQTVLNRIIRKTALKQEYLKLTEAWHTLGHQGAVPAYQLWRIQEALAQLNLKVEGDWKNTLKKYVSDTQKLIGTPICVNHMPTDIEANVIDTILRYKVGSETVRNVLNTNEKEGILIQGATQALTFHCDQNFTFIVGALCYERRQNHQLAQELMLLRQQITTKDALLTQLRNDHISSQKAEQYAHKAEQYSRQIMDTLTELLDRQPKQSREAQSDE